jgi:hypothetical protein
MRRGVTAPKHIVAAHAGSESRRALLVPKDWPIRSAPELEHRTISHLCKWIVTENCWCRGRPRPSKCLHQRPNRFKGARRISLFLTVIVCGEAGTRGGARGTGRRTPRKSRTVITCKSGARRQCGALKHLGPCAGQPCTRLRHNPLQVCSHTSSDEGREGTPMEYVCTKSLVIRGLGGQMRRCGATHTHARSVAS